MKNILIAGLLVVSTAAFAGGRNVNEPVNPPQPPIVVESAPGICAKFYNKMIPHYHYQDLELRALRDQKITTIGFETVALIGANGFCSMMIVPKIMESLCLHARANGISCVTGEEAQFNRPDAP